MENKLKKFEEFEYPSNMPEDLRKIADKYDKEFATYGTEPNEIDELESLINDAFSTDNIEEITNNLQEIKKKYPELTQRNPIWRDSLKRWHKKLNPEGYPR
jgi:DNA-directed RNA polymerase beta' subunit